jgi:hypothetical protein
MAGLVHIQSLAHRGTTHWCGQSGMNARSAQRHVHAAHGVSWLVVAGLELRQHRRLDHCHTPFRERGNEASICVPRMFKSHAWQQYDKHMQCYKITSNISYITTQGSEKDYIKAAELTKRSAAPEA